MPRGLILAIDLHHYPCLMHPVLASPICSAHEMGPGLEEDLDDLGDTTIAFEKKPTVSLGIFCPVSSPGWSVFNLRKYCCP